MTDNSDSCSKGLHCFKLNEEKFKTGQTTFVKIKIVSYISKDFGICIKDCFGSQEKK